MKNNKCARLLAVLSVAAIAAVSLSVFATADDSFADDTAYVSNFSDLKDALKQGTKLVIVKDNITLKESIIIGEGQRVDIRDNCTLTIPKGHELCNYGSIFVAGKIANKGDILQPGDSVNQIIVPTGSIEGKLELNLPDITVVPNGTNEFRFPYLTGVNGDVVYVIVKTYSADPGKYTYDTTLSEGKYTVSYDNDDNKYGCETHFAGTFTIKSNASPDGFDTVSTFEELKDYLANHPTGLVQVDSSFDVTEAITISQGQEVELLEGQTMTITSGEIYNQGAFSNDGTLVTNGHFYQKQERHVAFYNFGTVTGKVGLSYDSIDTLYRHVEVYDIRVFPTYDIYSPINLRCTPYDTEGTSYTYTSEDTPGVGEYTIEITNNTSSFDYFIHDAGKLNLETSFDTVEPDAEHDDKELIIIASVIIALSLVLIALAMVAARKK